MGAVTITTVAERIVARCAFSLRPVYALDARMSAWTADRARGYRFHDRFTAAAAIDERCRTMPDTDPSWVDPYLAAGYHVLRPTIEDEARAFVDPAAR